ncbi:MULTISPECIES: HAD-IIA family hydrolase [unclassified Streptomyces]|uniref:HAD-IIA family hydrolase n=1 Tax=unclassified Streptomyces TaxID=2593676 RepID=UPI002DDB9C55|nr:MULTISPECIES: HAD-IIA family hydrolase [unclassified Streptomyces]WSA90240.1 HAD-IIA family hydrolase [Streptomyces sp. NBC_01795]WSB74466.1 HAD-IIA family hydrolase [Streptomyces sp. NBC_01775]WSS45896.1 HAD-IIA family hydrolase [Streptomyces sp. NBC_01187]
MTYLSPDPEAGLPLAQRYDAALVDLDGVVYVGSRAVEHAVDSLTRARRSGMRLAYVTNNAFGAPPALVGRLNQLGVPAAERDIVTSAQAAARLAADRCPPGAPVLVVGGEALVAAVRARGLQPVGSADDRPVCVIQGFAPTVDWHDLAEAGYAVARGASWIVTNADRTAPTSRGTAPGNGALADVVALATGAAPTVAGKPSTALLREGAARTGARRPLMVGDRLDTDIQGAHRAGYDSLLVLTGVTTPAALLAAPASCRPTHLAADLRGLLTPGRQVAPRADGYACGGWVAVVQEGELMLSGRGDPTDALWAACAAAWSSPVPPTTDKALAAMASGVRS